MRTRIAALLPLIAVAATALLFVYPRDQTPSDPIKLFPDSTTYLSWGYGRPPVPFLYFSLIGHTRPAVFVQTIVSICSWTTLGWLALGTAGAVFAAGLAGSLWVSMWSYCVLSEGPTLSFGAAFLAATLVLGRRWTWPRFAVWSVCTLLYANLRVENIFLTPIFLALLLGWHRAHWRPIAALAAVMTGTFVVFGLLIDKQNHNWHIRMTNVVLTRILPDPQLAVYFHERGLPYEPNLLAWKGRMLAAYDPNFVEATPEFQTWLEEGSRRAYMGWLIGIEPHRRLVRDWDRVFTRAQYEHEYYVAGTKLPGVTMDLNLVYDATRLPLRQWLWLAAIPFVCALLSWRVAFVDLFAVGYLIALYLLAFVVYHGDSGELARHMSFVNMLYRMAPVIVFGCAWERVLAFVQRRWGTGEAAQDQVDLARIDAPAGEPGDISAAARVG